MGTDRTLPVEGTMLGVLNPEQEHPYGFHVRETRDGEEPTMLTSLVVPITGTESRHKIALDIDLPMKVVPSSTPGHGHLYIDKVLTWTEYQDVINVFARLGIIEEGYASACLAQGYSTLRLPWVKKGENDDPAAKLVEERRQQTKKVAPVVIDDDLPPF